MKIGFSVKFNKAKYPSKKKLIGKYCFLEPVSAKKHAKDLYKNFSLDKKGIDWTYMPTGPYKTFSSFKKYLTTDKLSGNPFFYSIYSKRLKTYCGLASYLRIKPEIGTIEVGWITYAKNLQRTVEATEAMYLMMKNVFENLGYRRYEWKCDSLNKKSNKAALRLGFKFEGIFRQATIYKKRNRDTSWYAIIDKDWKKIKKGYLKYLSSKNLDKNLNQKRSLKLN
ncbi:GNAT family N-acetyltransferase [Candidatus Pelagibacter sp. HIMB1611]|uniref:GNAT family N-acetyltransferase n=1 Tax=unclassified Candidatus Pelagibacter TaxID=2647897 RepID=UPI003F871382